MNIYLYIIHLAHVFSYLFICDNNFVNMFAFNLFTPQETISRNKTMITHIVPLCFDWMMKPYNNMISNWFEKATTDIIVASWLCSLRWQVYCMRWNKDLLTKGSKASAQESPTTNPEPSHFTTGVKSAKEQQMDFTCPGCPDKTW